MFIEWKTALKKLLFKKDLTTNDDDDWIAVNFKLSGCICIRIRNCRLNSGYLKNSQIATLTLKMSLTLFDMCFNLFVRSKSSLHSFSFNFETVQIFLQKLNLFEAIYTIHDLIAIKIEWTWKNN